MGCIHHCAVSALLHHVVKVMLEKLKKIFAEKGAKAADKFLKEEYLKIESNLFRIHNTLHPTEKRFPILMSDWRDNGKFSIPWSLLEPHERQANISHGQTLQRLAERGGLAPSEALAIIQDRPFKLPFDEIYDLWLLIDLEVKTLPEIEDVVE